MRYHQQLINMDDIKKMGYLKKLKTMKKKFFILRAESDSGPARLEYHDSEKKWKSGAPPKRVIYLKTCFNINRKLDTKHKWVIALYTKDDCFAVALDAAAELDTWLNLLLLLQHGVEWIGTSDKPKPNFEHVWEVNVKNKGLGNSRGILGPYRLCLTKQTLSLVQMSSNEPTIYEFPMISIRRCGHSESFFFMEVGRSTLTGAGELWMLTEDTLIAHNMHEAILNAMKSSNSKEDLLPWPRVRSHSNDSTKPITSHGNRRQTLNIISTHPVNPRERCDSMPSRTKTVSESHKDAPGFVRGPHTYDTRHQKGMHHRMSCSPPGTMMGPDGAGSGTCLSSSDNAFNLLDTLHIMDGSQLEPSIEEESPAYTATSFQDSSNVSADGYMEMQPGASLISPRLSLLSSPPNSLSILQNTNDYLQMASPTNNVITTPDDYMPMSPIGSLLANEMTTENLNGGSKISKVDQPTLEGYVPMAPLSENYSQPQKSVSPTEDEGYMDMAPLAHTTKANNNNLEASAEMSCSRRSSDSPSTDMCFAEYPLDKVQAYFTPSEEDEPMVRACSIGSRADCKVKNNRLDVDPCRTRAFSVGSNVKKSGGVGGSKLTVRGNKGAAKHHPQTPVAASAAVPEPVSGGGGKKSMSAPVLGTSPLLNNIWQHTNGISHGKKQSNNEDLMELDFPESQTEHRRSSSSLSGRPRANSKSSHHRISSIKTESNQQQQHNQGQKKLTETSDYLVMEAGGSARNLQVPGTETLPPGERKSSLPIAIAESSSSAKENRRLSDLDQLSNSGEYVNIDPMRHFTTTIPEISSGTTKISSGTTKISSGTTKISSGTTKISSGTAKISSGTTKISSGTTTLTSPVSSKFNPEYANLQYGFQSQTKNSLVEVKKAADETESDYTVMAPGVPAAAADVSTGSVQKKLSPRSETDENEEDGENVEERQLNYAALDLPPASNSADDGDNKNNTSPSSSSEEINTSTAAFYAQIDFAKSEGFRS